ncbi:hypothetical protein Tco_0753605 [Tanacetum coccineum]
MAAAAETDGGGRRVEESGCGDRIDPVMRSVFGVGRKSPPEKFSGGGATVVAGSGGGGGWPDSLREKRESSVSFTIPFFIMENANPPSTLGSFSKEPSIITHAKFTARINKLLQMRQTIDYLLFKTMNALTNQSYNSEIFCHEERIKELELRTQRRNNFQEELLKNRYHTKKELAYHKELGEPQPPFWTLEPKIRRGDPWSLKIPYVVGTVYMGHAYIDLQSPVNIMSRAYYNKIREKPFQARRNPHQPYKFCNFAGRAKNMHIYIGCYVYVVDFMILEDFGSVIDSGLSEVVLGQPFAHTSKLTYDESLGLIRFAQRDDEVMFRMPQRIKELDLVSSLEKVKFEAFFVENLKVRKKGFKHVLEKRKGYYKACLNLGSTYKQDRETIEKLKTNHV